MSREEILSLFYKTGALVPEALQDTAGATESSPVTITPHHTLRPEKVLQFPPFNRKLGYQIVRHFLELDIHVVMANAPDGVFAAVEVGRQLEARTIFPDEVNGEKALEHGFALHEGERVLVISGVLRSDDELGTAKSLIRSAAARHVGTGSIIDIRAKTKISPVRDVAVIKMLVDESARSNG